jgi:hypothetical protein
MPAYSIPTVFNSIAINPTEPEIRNSLTFDKDLN